MSNYKSFTEIIKDVGGATLLAATIDKPRQLVHAWLKRNSIPGWAWVKVSEFAATRDIEVTVENMAQIADKQRDEK